MKHRKFIGVYILLIALTIILFKDEAYFPVIITAIATLFFITLSIGVIRLKWGYFLKVHSRFIDTQILLSFDDGPNPHTTPKILDELKKRKISALFFVIGDKAKDHPELIKRAISEGHIVANHTQKHPHLFALMGRKKVHNEITNCYNTLHEIGIKARIFRPPVGYTNPIIARVLRQYGFKTIGWQLRSFDSVIKIPIKLKERLLRKQQSGDIILLHDNLEHTAAMLPEYINESLNNGIIFANKDSIKQWINEI